MHFKKENWFEVRGGARCFWSKPKNENRSVKNETWRSILDLERNDLEPPLTSHQNMFNYFFNLTSVADKKYFGARLEVVRGHFGPNRKMKTEV